MIYTGTAYRRRPLPGYWQFETRRHGIFRIVPSQGRWHLMYDGENLGSYHSPEAGLDDLVGGHTFSPSNGVETDEVGLPGDLSEWDFVVTR